MKTKKSKAIGIAQQRIMEAEERRATVPETNAQRALRIVRQRKERGAWEFKRRKTIGLLLDAASMLNDASMPDGPLEGRAMVKLVKIARLWAKS